MIDREFILNTEKTEWDFSNEILYNMCRENFSHERIDKTIGKTLLIGRTYAAAIERRKNKFTFEQNDNFYIDKVAPAIMNSRLDNYLNRIGKISKLDENDIPKILHVHFYLTKLIRDLTNQNKRSFSSKYLHFHIPNLYFIYDTRAVKAIRILKTKVDKKFKKEINSKGVDREYATFFYKCFEQKRRLEIKFRRNITNRHFDNILMKVVENKI